MVCEHTKCKELTIGSIHDFLQDSHVECPSSFFFFDILLVSTGNGGVWAVADTE